jgi:glycosyltransferase involved in cell wall biosynthesis
MAHAWAWLNAGERLYRRFVEDHGAPGIIHAHSAVYGGALAARIKHRADIPVVVTEHRSAFAAGTLKQWQRRLAGRVFRQVDARIAVSSSLGNLLERQFPGSFEPWDVVPNMVDRYLVEAGSSGRRPDTTEPFTILNVGVLTPIKAHDTLLRAFAAEFGGIPSVRLRIGGDGPLRTRLEGLARTLGITRQVTFLGALTREEVNAEMSNASLFVLPSEYETFGVVLIEALACGNPVVATACGGPESIVHPSNGLLVTVGDVEMLRGAMRYIRNHIAMYDPDGIRRDCLARFGEAAVVERLRAIYERVRAPSTYRRDGEPASCG